MIPDDEGALQAVTPAADRINAAIYALSTLMIFLAAPVTYVGVVQAALCDKLGASPTVANLPTSMYLFGFLAPLIAASAIPQRFERLTAAAANGLTSIMLGLVAAALQLPVGNGIKIAAVVGQGCVIGVSAALSQVYMLQCLRRGTTPAGKARSFKVAFGFGPIAAVLASLAAQYVLTGGVRAFKYPMDFAILYVFGAACMAVAAISNFRFTLPAALDAPRPPFLGYLSASIKAFAADRTLRVLWFGYLLWFTAIYATPNFSLYTKEALNRDPQDFSGIIMALRFACKSLAGFLLGSLTLRRGARAPVIATVLLTVAATVWAWTVPGYLYLFAFALMGAGELGGVYFPNYVVTTSPLSAGVRNQAVMALATPAASFAPALHGFLTVRFGFRGSFLFGFATSLTALLLIIWRLPAASGSLPGAKPPIQEGE